MNTYPRPVLFIVFGLIQFLAGQTTQLNAEQASVRLMRTPNEGIQPQTVIAEDGTLHVIYFSGEARGGDIWYVRKAAGSSDFSQPLRVNGQVRSAVATGTIRGAQLAVGRAGRVHVVWNGSVAAEPKGPGETPFLYTRLIDERTGFEAQRNLITWAGGIDGGGSVAADEAGNVFAVWHAVGDAQNAPDRAVYVVRSSDDGATFAREVRANPDPTGACECCGLSATADREGRLVIAYRAAGQSIHRDSVLLMSSDRAQSFRSLILDPWEIVACPMSSYALAVAEESIVVAWETRGRVFWGAVDRTTFQLSDPLPVPSSGRSRQPSLATNNRGETLLAWTEGTAWGRGGSVAWQLHDHDRKPLPVSGRREGVAVWGSVSVYAEPGGNFVILY